MLMAADPVPVYRWPRIRERRDGSVRVSGRCLGVLRWRLLLLATRIALLATGVYLLTITFLPEISRSWGGWALEHQRTIDGWIEDLRLANPWLVRVLGESAKHLAAMLVFVVAPLLIIASRPLAWLVSLPLCLILWPLVSRRIRLTIRPDRVILHRLLWRVVLPRQGEDSQISFRVAELNTLSPTMAHLAQSRALKFFSPKGPVAAVLMHGLRSYTIACPLIARRSDEIVAACLYAMKRTRPMAGDLHGDW